MKIRYFWICVLVFAIAHGLCHFMNLYFRIWWTDIAVHIWAGFTAGLFMWWLIENRSRLKGIRSRIVPLAIFMFGTLISVFWEFWEFSNWRYPWLRDGIGQLQKQYYPYWGNNLGDIFSGLLGGVLGAIIYILVNRSRKL